MGDIADCRAVLPDLKAVRDVQQQLTTGSRTLTFTDVSDYVQYPKASGYRAVHIHAIRDAKRVEIQLRTRNQQAWADLVEDLEATLRCGLKDGYGPEPVIAYFRVVGDTFGHVDHDREVSSEQRRALSTAADDLTAYRREL